MLGFNSTSTMTSNGYDGFHSVQDPAQYLEAPSTIGASTGGGPGEGGGSMYHFDIASGSYFDLSPMLNVQDPVALHYLVQKSIAEAQGFKVLSYQELDEAKKESTVLHSRLSDLTNKLSMEYKLKDAASSISKLQSDEGGTSTGRRSFLFNKKRSSKQAEEEVDVANRKISGLEQEIAKLSERANDIDTRILKHNVGLLALTHQSSASSSAKAFEQHLNTKRKSEGVPASPRMLQRHSRNASSSSDPLVYQMISNISEHLGHQQLSPTPSDEGEGSLAKLNELTNQLIAQNSKLQNDRQEIDNKIDDIQQVCTTSIKKTAPDAVVDVFDTELLRHQLDSLGSGSGSVDREVSGNGGGSEKVKNLLQQQLDQLTQSYEQNRAELEKLELENVDLKTNLRDVKFQSQAKIQEMENELKGNQERIQDWKDRCETLKSELESVVKSLEDLTRQTVEYESERQQLETKVNELQTQLFEKNRSNLDKRASTMAVPVTPKSEDSENYSTDWHEPSSVTILRHEFKRIIMDMNNKHMQALKKEQADKKRLESLLRSIKTSSYAANLPPGKLESLGVQ